MRKRIIFTFAVLVCLVSAHHEEYQTEAGKWKLVGHILGIILLVLTSAIVAGLQLGLMSLDLTNLRVLEMAGTPEQRKYVSSIIPIRENGHLLLTTLLLTNTALNETFPIIFDEIFDQGILSIAISTIIIVILAEIIPQAFFKKHALKVGAMFARPVRVLIVMLIIPTYFIALALDFLCGHDEGLTYNVTELGALLEIHYKRKAINRETANLTVNSILTETKCVSEIMKCSNGGTVARLSEDMKLCKLAVNQYLEFGHTFILVTSEKYGGIMGALDLKRLDESAFEVNVGELPLKRCIFMDAQTTVAQSAFRLLQPNQRESVVLVKQEIHRDISAGALTAGSRNSRINFFLPGYSESTLHESMPMFGVSPESIIGFFTINEILDQLSGEPIKEELEGEKVAEVKGFRKVWRFLTS